MSIEYFVYAPASPVRVNDLEETLDLAGWIYRFVDGKQGAHPVAIVDAQFALGIPLDSDEAVEAERVTWDDERLRTLYADNRVALVELSVRRVTEEQKDRLAEIADEEAPRALKERVRKARMIYSLRSSARRNELDLPFQQALWLALALVTSGIAHDPETGEFHDLEEDE